MKPDLDEEQRRAEAEARAADLALTAAAGNRRTAKDMLRVTLQAIGAVPYKHGPGNWRFGAVREA